MWETKMWETIVKSAIPIILSIVIGGLATYIISTCKFGRRIQNLEDDVEQSLEERKLVLKSLLACLKGLHEQGCNGPVTKGIEELESWLYDASHQPSGN